MQSELVLKLFLILLCIVYVDPEEISSTLVIELNNSTGNVEIPLDQGSCILRHEPGSTCWDFLSRGNEVNEGTDIELKFNCKKGYRLLQDAYSSCDKYQNRSSLPKCAKTCPQLHSTSTTILKCFNKDNEEIGCDAVIEGNYASVTCASNYELPSGVDTTLLCSNGRWNSSLFPCEPVCGRKVSHNTTGEDSTDEYPWIVGIYRNIIEQIMLTAAGSIIAEKLVLTAANGLMDYNRNLNDSTSADQYIIVAGAPYSKYKDARNLHAQYLDVMQIIINSNYRTDIYSGDIAIVITKQKFVFNAFVFPVCIIGVNNITLGSEDVGMVVGWGPVKQPDHFSHEPSEKLKVLEIPFKLQSTCVAELPQNWTKRFYSNDKICAGLYNQSKGVCQGDGGSGLIYKNQMNDKYYIHGIVSIGISKRGLCDLDQNALYTNVTFYKDFVYNEMKKYLVTDCTLPPHPDNGKWVIENEENNPGDTVSSDTLLIVRCDGGFKPSSDKTKVQCGLSSFMPTCEKLCPPHSKSLATVQCFDRSHKEINCDEATDGSTLSYRCPPLHIPPFGYDTEMHCNNGEWDIPGPQCNPVCGKRVTDDVVTLLYGAKEVDLIEYPWVTALYRNSEAGYQHICGGSIISYKLIVTAAHCVTNNYGEIYAPENYMVAAGKLYNKFEDPRDPRPQYLQVFYILANENYRSASRKYLGDIALLVTKQAIIFNHYVHPICFQGVNQITLKTGDVGVVTGWGVSETNKPSEELRLLEIPYKSPQACAKELPSNWELEYNLIDKICAGLYNQNRSVCRGDSGGGLFYKNGKDGRYYLHGVVSLGVGKKGMCDFRHNSLYTSVSFHYDFIYNKFSTYTEDCKLPPHPENGKWMIEDEDKKPGDKVSADTILKFVCNEDFVLFPDVPAVTCESVYLKMPKCVDNSFILDSLYNFVRTTCVYDGKVEEFVTPEELDTTQCSYVIYNSVGLKQDGHLRVPSSLSGVYKAAVSMKKNKESLKVLVTVYGFASKDEDLFSDVAANAATRTTFAESVVDFLEKYNYDGVNIHWDAPMAKDRDNYGLLIRELKEKLKPQGWTLTATVFRSPTNLGYNHIEMYHNLDWINVECYDRPSTVESYLQRNFLESCAESWLSHSYKDKLSLGLGFFGRYIVFNNQTQVESNQESNSLPGSGRLDGRHPERVTYSEICQKFANWTRVWDDNQKQPYIHNGSSWIGYENADSIKLKAAYIKKNKYFGVTVFPVNGDDFRAKCGPKKLLDVVKKSTFSGINKQSIIASLIGTGLG